MLEFAGGPYLVSGLASDQQEAIAEDFGSTCRPQEAARAAAVEIRWLRAPGEDFQELDVREIGEFRLDVDYRPDSVRLAGFEFMGLVEWRPQLTGTLWFSERGTSFRGAFENYLRVLVAYRMIECGGVVLHSAALADASGAYLCPGRSGAGKSTLCRLGASGWQVLSDDLNILLTDGGTAQVEPFPLAGDYGKVASAGRAFPLRAVCRLHQAREEALAPISAGEALGLMFASSPYVNFDPYRGERALTLLGEVASRYPVYALRFSLDGRLDGLERISRRPQVSAA
ncbi:MAG: hypothetical protein GY856_18130 [bacterium]|nr:hypothetical protein [bacterium]